MNPGEICHLQRSEHGPFERVRVLVPFGEGRGDVLAVFLRLSDGRRLIFWGDGRITEAVA